MKKLLHFCAAAFAVILLFSFAGCSARSPITADEFEKQAKAQGFTVKDGSTTNADVDKYKDAIKSETETEVVFLAFKTDTAASEMFANIKKNISQGANASAKTLDSETYSKYTVSNGELSHTLIRMDSTIVYGKATSTHQNQVDDLIKAMKY